jgi:ADP-heptose:LPS heptosyltransferase
MAPIARIFMKTTLKKVEVVLRHVLVYPFMRLILRNPPANDAVDLSSIKKILILRNDRIGDMVVTTPIFRKLKEMHPGLTICVFAAPGNAEIIRGSPFVDEIYIAYSNAWKLWKELRRCKSRRVDVVVNFVFNRTTAQGLIAHFVAPHGFKVGQGPPKYQMYFNRLLDINRTNDHMVDVLAKFVDLVFGTTIGSGHLSPEIEIPDSAHSKVNEFLRQNKLIRATAKALPGSYAIINFSAVNVLRRMSVAQAVGIIKAIDTWQKQSPVLISPPGENDTLHRILSGLGPFNVKVYPPAPLLEIASIIKGARYIVTCDTAVVHFASAVQTPVFALYTPTGELNHEWQPYGVRHACLFAQRGSGVDSIPVEKIIEELSVFQAGQFPDIKTL